MPSRAFDLMVRFLVLGTAAAFVGALIAAVIGDLATATVLTASAVVSGWASWLGTMVESV